MKILTTLLIYIAGFGLSDTLMDYNKVSYKYRLCIYTLIGLISLFYYYKVYYEDEKVAK